MKIIDLYNKVVNCEELPECIQWRDFKFKKCDIGEEYYSIDCGMWLFKELDSSVLNEEIKELEEEKKIPEKLNYKYKNMYGNISQHKQSEIDIIDTLNQVIDYLKNKGE